MTTTHVPRFRALAVASGFALALAMVALSALPVGAAEISGNLSLGSSGADVTTLQTYLASDSTLYPERLVTGYYGTLTQAAVTRFQARYGIAQVGVVGPITRAKLNELMAGGNGGGPVTGGDVWAPIMTTESVATTTTSATITWTTTEPARARVMYGTSYPFLYATAPAGMDTTVDTMASVQLTGLSPNTTYFYVRESVDPSGNVMLTTARTFRTNP